MKKTALPILILIFTIGKSYCQTDQITFQHELFDLNANPRTQISSMSIKLFDDYHSYRPTPATAPGNNSYGTLFAMYGRSNHWEHNLYFGSDKKIYYRMAVYPSWTAENGTLGGYNEWRTLLDSKSNIESSGVLKLTGNGDHYFSQGNVGIGTTATGSHRLAVEGSIGAREIKVEASGWSDFVFENNYKLRTLEEVEEHITENGHLPEIPSEAEVTENGINLGEMNAKLLQKIEELTLYMIDMNKEVKQLKSENQELNEKVKNLENE